MKELDQALEAARKNAEHWSESDLYRQQGELLEKSDWAETEIIKSYSKAIQIAHMQEARLWELRAVTAMVRLGERNTQLGTRRDELTRIYAWFTEGIDTKDLREARELLNKEF